MMKKTIVLAGLSLMLSMPALALPSLYAARNHVFGVALGAGGGTGSYDEVASFGPSGAFAYRYYYHRFFSIGLDAGYTDFGKETKDGVQYDTSALLFGPFLRLDLTPTAPFINYFFGGMSRLLIFNDVTDAAGNDTSQLDKGGWFAGYGLERRVHRNWIAGVEGRYDRAIGTELKSLTVRATVSFKIGTESSDGQFY